MTPRRNLLTGTAAVLCADLLIVPMGLLTVALLSRRFGPEDYGLFAVTAALVSWIEWGIGSCFSRLTIHVTSEDKDWPQSARALMRWHVVAGVAAAVLLISLAHPLARLLGDTRFALYLGLFALDLPLFALGQAYRHILIGRGHYLGRATASAGRWVIRFVAIAVLVELGFSIPGAIVGCVIASAVEIAICRWHLTPSAWPVGSASLVLPPSALPIILSTLGLAWYTKVDLLILQALEPDGRQAGLYAAAQNLAILPGLFAQALSSLLIARLSAEINAGHLHEARRTATTALNVSAGILPLAGIVAATAPELAEFVFGAPFRAAGPLLGVLMLAAVAHVVYAVATGILIGTGQHAVAASLTGPLIPLSLLAQPLAISAYGSAGAAWTTALLALIGCTVSCLVLSQRWNVRLAYSTLARSLSLCAGAALLSALGPTTGLGLAMKLSGIAAACAVLFWLMEDRGLRPMSLRSHRPI